MRGTCHPIVHINRTSMAAAHSTTLTSSTRACRSSGRYEDTTRALKKIQRQGHTDPARVTSTLAPALVEPRHCIRALRLGRWQQNTMRPPRARSHTRRAEASVKTEGRPHRQNRTTRSEDYHKRFNTPNWSASETLPASAQVALPSPLDVTETSCSDAYGLLVG